MRLKITKPKEGKVSVVLLDRRGATGKNYHAGTVEVSAVPEALSDLLEQRDAERLKGLVGPL